MPPRKKALKKTVVAIFAHPDDEAFGPSGTLTILSKTYNAYLLCATRGEAGGSHPRLAQIRSAELKKSAQIIGIKKVYFLGFTDGSLSNSLYHILAKKIEYCLKKLKPEIVMTSEPRGVSGHIDHITVSMATSYVCQKMPFVKTVLYHCLRYEDTLNEKKYFIYFPPGYKKEEIDKTVDISKVWEIKLKAMMAHQSQNKDAKRILKNRIFASKEEYF